MKSCSSILGSRDFKSILRILPFCPSTYFAIALSASKHPTSNARRRFNFSLSLDSLSHWTRTFEESPPLSGSWPLDEACWYTARGTELDPVEEDFKSVWRVLIALRRGSLVVVKWVRGFFRRIVVLWEPILRRLFEGMKINGSEILKLIDDRK